MLWYIPAVCLHIPKTGGKFSGCPPCYGVLASRLKIMNRFVATIVVSLEMRRSLFFNICS